MYCREKDVQALVTLLIESLEIRKKTHNDKEMQMLLSK